MESKPSEAQCSRGFFLLPTCVSNDAATAEAQDSAILRIPVAAQDGCVLRNLTVAQAGDSSEKRKYERIEAIYTKKRTEAVKNPGQKQPVRGGAPKEIGIHF